MILFLKKWIPLAALVAVLAFGIYYFQTPKSKCPDDYATFEESSAAFDEWLVAYLETNPRASVPEMTEARKQFYIENNCTAALERFEEGERANEAIPAP